MSSASRDSADGAPPVKTVLVVPDGVGVRNFLCTEFAPLAACSGELVVWHGLPETIVDEHRTRLGPAVRWHRLEIRREPIVSRVLRSGKFFSQLERFPEPGAAPLLRNRHRNRVGRWVHRAGRVLGKALALVPRALPVVERWHGRTTLSRSGDDPWQSFLAAERPDVVFCTHQRASVAVPPMAAARRLGIPTASFIYSWDNLPKGRMAVWPDHYLVWSEKMAADLRRYYPEATACQVHVVGTPQFEPYFDDALLVDREYFCATLGLDPGRPIVLFSGDDASTSPRDPGYLADLAEAMRGEFGATGPQLAFRPSPADRSNRYRAVLDQYPEIAVSEPAWSSIGEEGWEQVVPSPRDLALLANLARHCAVVVNLGSTMALDFAIVGKPAIYVDYEQPGIDGAWDWRAADIYRLPHFASVERTDPVLWARSPGELATQVRRATTDPDALTENRAAWIAIELVQPVNRASRRCIDALVRIAAVGAS